MILSEGAHTVEDRDATMASVGEARRQATERNDTVWGPEAKTAFKLLINAFQSRCETAFQFEHGSGRELSL